MRKRNYYPPRTTLLESQCENMIADSEKGSGVIPENPNDDDFDW